MTIALGILASDGVVLAADTQETGYIKEFALKIHYAMTQIALRSSVRSAIAISGSGPGVYLDAIANEITRNFHDNQRTCISDLHADLESYLISFYGTHVIPLLPHIDREFSLVIGAQIEGQSALWISDATKVHEVLRFEAVGTGRPYAKMAIEMRIITPDARTAVLLAVRAISEAKDRDQYCGKSTQIVCLKDNHAYAVPWYHIKQAEELFGRYSGAERSAFQYALGIRDTDDTIRAAKVASWLEDMRVGFKKLSSELLQDSP